MVNGATVFLGCYMGMNVLRRFACIMSVELSKRLISSRGGADHLT